MESGSSAIGLELFESAADTVDLNSSTAACMALVSEGDFGAGKSGPGRGHGPESVAARADDAQEASKANLRTECIVDKTVVVGKT